jgi:hypothetical protein
MSADDFIRYFQHALKQGQREFGILGGEPMMAPHFIPIMQFMADNRFYFDQFRLFSNLFCTDAVQQLADIDMSAHGKDYRNYLVWNNSVLYKKDKKIIDMVHANMSTLLRGRFGNSIRPLMSLTLTTCTTLDDLAYLPICRDLFGINALRVALDVGTHASFDEHHVLSVFTFLKKERFSFSVDTCGFLPPSLFSEDTREKLQGLGVSCTSYACFGFCGDVTPTGKLIPCMPHLCDTNTLNFLDTDWQSAVLFYRAFPFTHPCKKGAQHESKSN